MSYSYDFFVGHLRCPVCKQTSAADYKTNMQTYIREHPQAEMLGVGAALSVPIEDMEERCYVALRAPESDVPMRIGHTWTCPACRSVGLWAEVVVEAERITAVDVISLRDALQRLNFVVIDIVDVIEDLTELTYGEIMGGDIGDLAQSLV